MILDFPLSGRRARILCFLLLAVMMCCDGALNLALASQAVELTWTPSPSPDVVGYTVYFGTESGLYPNSVAFSDVSDVIVPGLAGGQTYFFAVSAVDVNGNESERSSEATYTVPVATPLEIHAQAVSPTSQDVELNWNPSPENDVYGYKVYYGTQSGVYTNSWINYYTTDVILAGLAGGVTYYFAVSPMDAYGDENILSTEASVTVPVSVPLVLQAQGVSPTSRDVQLTWNPSPNSDVNGYRVYYGTQHGVYTNSSTFYYANDGIISDLAGGTTYYFAVAPIGVNGVENILSNEAVYVVPVPLPIVLQGQIIPDENGRPYLMRIYSSSVVKGAWELDYSADLQNWSPYAYSYGYGNGDGHDVDIEVWMDPAQPLMFYRVINY